MCAKSSQAEIERVLAQSRSAGEGEGGPWGGGWAAVPSQWVWVWVWVWMHPQMGVVSVSHDTQLRDSREGLNTRFATEQGQIRKNKTFLNL